MDDSNYIIMSRLPILYLLIRKYLIFYVNFKFRTVILFKPCFVIFLTNFMRRILHDNDSIYESTGSKKQLLKQLFGGGLDLEFLEFSLFFYFYKKTNQITTTTYLSLTSVSYCASISLISV